MCYYFFRYVLCRFLSFNFLHPPAPVERGRDDAEKPGRSGVGPSTEAKPSQTDSPSVFEWFVFIKDKKELQMRHNAEGGMNREMEGVMYVGVGHRQRRIQGVQVGRFLACF